MSYTRLHQLLFALSDNYYSKSQKHQEKISDEVPEEGTQEYLDYVVDLTSARILEESSLIIDQVISVFYADFSQRNDENDETGDLIRLHEERLRKHFEAREAFRARMNKGYKREKFGMGNGEW